MKKIGPISLFILWIVFGIFSRQIRDSYLQLHEPLVQDGQFQLWTLIQSIGDALHHRTSSQGLSYDRFDSIYQLLSTSYYDHSKLQTGVMLEKALKSFVDAIDDPYTVYLDTHQNSGFQEELKWQTDFEWIGAVVSKKESYVLIEEIVKWSPAYIAWLMPLDRILMIGTWSTKNLDIDTAVKAIRWPKWSQVLLTIERIQKNGKQEVFEKTVTRDTVTVPSLTSTILTGKNNSHIAYITISIIGEETEHLLEASIASLKKTPFSGIIIDLRGNWWGLLQIANEIASHFLAKWVPVVQTKYASFPQETYVSQWYNEFWWSPLVILVDGMTASAGEIIALALKEKAGATLVGTQTFGKWSIQTMDEFPDGSSLKYTIGKRFSPRGDTIDKVGISPDVIIPFNADIYTKQHIDVQLEKAKSILNGK